MRKYTSLTTASAGTLAWERDGLEYVDCAGADPSSAGVDVYSRFHHYTVDYSKPQGQGWTYKGELCDDLTYPADPRLTDYHTTGSRIIVINGRKYQLINSNGEAIYIYRFQSNSQITVPYAALDRSVIPAGQATAHLSIWVDKATYNGSVDSGETDLAGTALPTISGDQNTWHVDANGDVWTMGGRSNGVGTNQIWHFKMTLNSSGDPTWSNSNSEVFNYPAEFTNSNPDGNTIEPLRLYYVPSTDTMYIGGYTNAQPKISGAKFGYVGTQIVRYNNWRTSRTVAYTITLPAVTTTDGVASMDISGNLIATVMYASHRVNLYNLNTGAAVTNFLPGPEVAGQSGNLDFIDALHMYQRPNQEYVILQEEDYLQKNLMYRYNPWISADINNTGLAGSSSYAQNVFTVNSSGPDLAGSSDGFQYYYLPVTGDCTMIARIASESATDVWAKAGLMIRETLTAGSAFAIEGMTSTTTKGAIFNYRTTTGGTIAGVTGGGNALPQWVKLVRAGSNFSGYTSTDGVTWTQDGSTVSISMASSVYIGFAVTSHSTTALNTATFDNVSLAVP